MKSVGYVTWCIHTYNMYIIKFPSLNFTELFPFKFPPLAPHWRRWVNLCFWRWRKYRRSSGDWQSATRKMFFFLSFRSEVTFSYYFDHPTVRYIWIFEVIYTAICVHIIFITSLLSLMIWVTLMRWVTHMRWVTLIRRVTLMRWVK